MFSLFRKHHPVPRPDSGAKVTHKIGGASSNPTAPHTPRLKPVIASGPGATRPPADGACEKVLEDYSHVPKVSEILSGTSGGFALPKGQSESVVLLRQACDARLALIVTQEFRRSENYLTLRDRVRRQYPTEAAFVSYTAAKTVIAQIYGANQANNNEAPLVFDETRSRELIGFLHKLLEEALVVKATDIHFVIRRDTGSLIQRRVHGKLEKAGQYSTEFGSVFCGFLYTKLAEDGSRSHSNYNARVTQRCMIPTEVSVRRPDGAVENVQIKLRYQSAPMLGGTDVTLRILRLEESDEKALSLAELGYEESQQREIELAVRTSVGAIIVSGITGSGKSTTLKTMMAIDDDGTKKRYSAEDPVEYRMPNVSQLIVNSNDSDSDGDADPFKPAKKAFMRMDPDVVMMGEMRDSDTASFVKYMVQTGHQVMSTVHAISVIDTYARLADIGIPLSALTGRRFITLFITQSLMPVLCDDCKRPANKVLTEQRLELLERKFLLDTGNIFVANEGGCEHCRNRGYVGQTVIAEVMSPTAEIRAAILAGDNVTAEAAWRGMRKTGFDDPDMTGKTSFEHGLYKVSRGIVDPRDVEGAFEPLEKYEVFPIAE